MSGKPWKTFVLKQWKSVLSSLHSKEKPLPQWFQLSGKEQGVCEAETADTKHFFTEVVLTADVLKVCVL